MRTLQARLGLLAGLLAVEGGVLAACFDAEPILDGSHAWWARLLARGGTFMPLAIAVATATAMFAGPRLRDTLLTSIDFDPRRRVWPLACAHGAAFASLFALTSVVFVGRAGGAWAALWLVAALLTGLSAAELALPGRTYLVIGRRLAGALVASAAIGVVAWAAGTITSTWWHPLGRSTMWGVHRLVAQFSVEPVIVPERFIVGTGTFQAEIAPDCSGYQGIGLVWVFLAVYLWVFRERLRFPRALLLLPLATAIMWAANIVRIAALIGVGTMVSRNVAAGGFHANSGSLVLCGVALGLGWLAHRSPFFSAAPADAAPVAHAETNPTVAYLMPLMAILVTAMVTGIVSAHGFDGLYGLRVLTATGMLLAFRRQLPAPGWRPAWQPLAVGIAVFVLWLALEPARAPDATPSPVGDALAALPTGLAAVWLAFRIVGAVVTVPLAEELAFRGYLARRVMSPDFEAVSLARLSPIAVLVSSVLFGAMHDRLLAGTLAGVAYAWVLRQRGALGDAVVAHGTTNALLAAWVLVTRRWELW